jgi:DNA repair exonuclease SbcCD ATPase subunit
MEELQFHRKQQQEQQQRESELKEQERQLQNALRKQQHEQQQRQEELKEQERQLQNALRKQQHEQQQRQEELKEQERQLQNALRNQQRELEEEEEQRKLDELDAFSKIHDKMTRREKVAQWYIENEMNNDLVHTAQQEHPDQVASLNKVYEKLKELAELRRNDKSAFKLQMKNPHWNKLFALHQMNESRRPPNEPDVDSRGYISNVRVQPKSLPVPVPPTKGRVNVTTLRA